MKLVIAEKPSVAISIAKVIGANKSCVDFITSYLEDRGVLLRKV